MARAHRRHFDIDLEWDGSGRAALSSRHAAIIGALSPGQDAGWTSEDLLLSSLSLCLTSAFRALAAREDIDVARYHCRTEATVGDVKAGLGSRPGFTFITVQLDVTVAPEHVQRARELMVEAKHHCLIANALMPPVHLEMAVVAEPVGALA